MNQSIINDECVVCLETLNVNQKLVKCQLCHKCTHYKCYNKWIGRDLKLRKEKRCLYCQQEYCTYPVNKTCLDKLKGFFKNN